ncbi:MAG: lysophospholipase [Deltaproteobacteria bacterium]|nr:lysophospholipase [Deltaproteobacteria bacterium]
MECELATGRKLKFWKLLIGATAVTLAIYAFSSTFIWARQAHFIFRPERIIAKTPAEYQLPFEDVYVKVNDGNGKNERIHSWWIPAEYPRERYLLYLHGSALNIGANITHARRFHQMGFSVLLVSYRGYGKSDGTFPTEAQVYSDAQAAWAYLVEQKGIDPGAIFIYGHSLGGAVAIQLALNNPAAGGLIVEATFTSIADMARRIPKYRIFPIALIVHQRFDSIKKVSRLQVPVLYIHGTNDKFVPHAMSHELYKRTASSKQLKLIDGGGHNNSAAVGGAEYLQAVRNFIDFVRKAG